MAWQAERYSTPEVMVAVPHKGAFSSKFVMAFRNLNLPGNSAQVFETGRPIDFARSIMATKAIQAGARRIFFIDSDIIVAPDTYEKLAEVHSPIISGVYFSRSPPYEMVASVNLEPLSHTLAGRPQQHEVHEVGMGCCLIDTRVFHRIGQSLPWRCLIHHEKDAKKEVLTYDYNSARESGFSCRLCHGALMAPFFHSRMGFVDKDSLSEDYYFCHLARKTGFPVYVMLNAVVGHELGNLVIDEKGLNNTTIPVGAV